MTRREFILVSGAVAWRGAALAEQSSKIPRIGYLEPGPPSNPIIGDILEGFRAGLRDLGYEEGKDLILELRFADGNYNRLPELAEDLVHQNVDVLVAMTTPGTVAAKKATSTIPIVSLAGDLVGTGLVVSLKRPGGNVTGVTLLVQEMHEKRLELLKEIFPQSSRMAVLFNPKNVSTFSAIQAMASTAPSLNIKLQKFEATAPEELTRAFSAMDSQHFDCVVIVDDAIYDANAKLISELAIAQRLPTIAPLDIAESGALLGYGPHYVATARHMATFVQKIINGAKPEHLPVEQATRLKLVINLKTARALGIELPSSLLIRADEVIE